MRTPSGIKVGYLVTGRSCSLKNANGMGPWFQMRSLPTGTLLNWWVIPLNLILYCEINVQSSKQSQTRQYRTVLSSKIRPSSGHQLYSMQIQPLYNQFKRQGKEMWLLSTSNHPTSALKPTRKNILLQFRKCPQGVCSETEQIPINPHAKGVVFAAELNTFTDWLVFFFICGYSQLVYCADL